MNSINRPVAGCSRRFQPPASLDGQRGVSLFIALVALVLMTIAGFALMRSVDTGNVIAGNMAFREVTVHAADLGIEDAADYLNVTISPAPDGNLPNGCVAGTSAANLGTCLYSARTLPENDFGLPFVDWTSTATIPETTVGAVTYQYVVDRLCNPDTTVTVDLGKAPRYGPSKELCVTAVLDEGKSFTANKAYSGGMPSRITPIHYRLTVRVRGPRNTVSFVQTLMER